MKSPGEIAHCIVGKYCWGVSWDCQLNLELSFGEPTLRIRHPYAAKSSSQRVKESAAFRSIRVKGKWWLWVFCAYWRLSISPTQRVTGASALAEKRAALRRLDGQKLKSVKIDPDSGRTVFTFDLGAVLEVRRMARDDADIWTLYMPTGYVLSVQNDNMYAYAKGSTRPEELKRWPLKSPNQALLPTPTAVTPPAAQVSRQP